MTDAVEKEQDCMNADFHEMQFILVI